MVNYTLQDEGSSSEVEGAHQEEYQEYSPVWEFWVPGVLLPCVGCLGLMGNTISIIILSRPQMKSSINCLLIGLASFDLILIITSILMFGLPSIHTHCVITGGESFLAFYYEQIFPYITPVVFPVGLMAQTGSVYLTVCVAVERYVAVCHPLKAKSLCTFGRAKMYVVCTAILSIVYNMPRFWEVTWSNSYSPVLNKNTTEVVPTMLRLDQYYIEIYINWMYLIFLYLAPFSLLAVFNILIYREVRRASRVRAQLSRNQKRELGLATMLLCVVMVFFLCNFLALVVNILEHFGTLYHPLTQTNNLLITVNSSVNFIIYCIFGEKFKRIFFKMFCSMTGRGSPHGQSELLRYPSHIHHEHIGTVTHFCPTRRDTTHLCLPLQSLPQVDCRMHRCLSLRQNTSPGTDISNYNPSSEHVSSSSEQESLCQEDIQRLLVVKQSVLSLDRWDIQWQCTGVVTTGV